MKNLLFTLCFILSGLWLSAQVKQQLIPTPYDFTNRIKFSMPPEISGDTAAVVPNRAIAVIGSKIFIKDTTWKEVTASGAAGPQGPQGLQGPAGDDGNKWYEGSGTPDGGSYNVGDFYLNRTSGDFLEKTGASEWLVRGNLRGPQGPQGLQGIPGANGSNGTNGAPGAQGPKGDPGTGVTIKGSVDTTSNLPVTGSPGDSYLVKDSLWVWDEENTEWSNVGLIRGPEGAEGPQGTAGSKWYDQAGTPVPGNGAVGDFYINRTTGDYYEKTAPNTWTSRGNIKGPQGAAGTPGAAGAAGVAGSKWYTQSGAPISGNGAVGDFYMNLTTGDYYEKTAVSTWTSRGNLKGPQGDAGTPGANGTNGSNGAPGADGSKWYDGAGTPSGGTGINGDYYLNKSNGDYYLKAGGTWSMQGNLRGPAGSGGSGSGGAFINNF